MNEKDFYIFTFILVLNSCILFTVLYDVHLLTKQVRQTELNIYKTYLEKQEYESSQLRFYDQ